MARLVITGGSGTLGRSLIRRALADPQWTAIRSYSRDEQKAAALDADFAHTGPFKAVLGDVRDPEALRMAFRGADTVIHAAALKRVDVGAYSPAEIFKTNILGTMNVVDAAITCGVRRVVVVSSDKAVNPINVYGASKYCAEVFAVQANTYGHGVTKIAAVRYGNILGSRGSVIHIWRDQLRRGLPLSITDPTMTRFIMTIEAAVDLVLFAAAAMQGGEVFIPVLPSATMLDLSTAVARLAGATVHDTVTTGLRAGGEKLAESLLNEEEPRRTVRVAGRDYLAVLPTHHEWRQDEAWPGSPVSPRFELRSDTGLRITDVGQLMTLMSGTEACRD